MKTMKTSSSCDVSHLSGSCSLCVLLVVVLHLISSPVSWFFWPLLMSSLVCLVSDCSPVRDPVKDQVFT